MKLENNYTQIHTSISICAFPLFHTKVKIRNNKMSKQEDQLTLATTILVMVGRTNVVVESVIIFCQSRKTRIFTFFISLEKHLKFIIS